MSSAKSKKKSKSAMIPKPITIKKEDDHMMYPMEHYIDDRVELIRQIFASLKPKTITNLAPEFLKKSKLEDIQEQCLNEILGISKKRLLSVINSSKCPTDTETSDEDIHSVDEHISLEEISSDSDISDKKGAGAGAAKGSGKRKKNMKVEADNGNNKQFSVLELLELQARARAIRSQLALEPVTKIEVGTDSEEEKSQIKKTPTSSKKTVKTTNGRPSSSKQDQIKRPATATVTNAKPNGEATSTTAPTKRIKLKRNFRKQTREEDSNDEIKATENTVTPIEKLYPKREARSPSPDVIPIIAVPETLFISDSDDEKVVEKHAETSQHAKILSVVSIEAPIKLNDETEAIKPSVNDSPADPPMEAEEGEILEEEERLKTDLPIVDEKNIEESDVAVEDALKTDASPTNESTKKEQESSTLEDKKIPSEATDSRTQSVESSENEDDSNDDVISLEGGDLVNEMKEHMKEDVKELIETTPTEEVICLDDSSEEDIKDKKGSESWNQRWLNSSKVSKVLATSRLGNRVRNKIKQSKKAKKLAEEAVAEAELSKPQEVIFISKHQDGSVQQYKELLENVQQKTDVVM